MLDKTDQEIIQELQKDGRQSYRRIARKLHVTEGTVRVRVRNLVGRNIIKITAMIDPDKLGYHFACIMGLEVKLADLERVAVKLTQNPNVYYLADIAGHFDLMAILFFHTTQELANFVQKIISEMPEVTRTETFVNMNIRKKPWNHWLDVASLL
jgi:Lrp/AsnC family transcriptional regulator for asnA, asnC and gidA